MLALDYPHYEVIAVDDRSEDATGAILQAAAKNDARLKPVRVDSLPPGWLGKPHALEKAYERSTGDWLVFTELTLVTSGRTCCGESSRWLR